ncbi:F-box only protein 28-like [Daktulosphaira vitifoliae]|uniref:F-box only protein 28-like n=1 Tax=Daktulosphaira vitifoliae TaxID=58002 RepID=UPI0021AAD26C|nr:F-box only protein 28-like [Daktulosphaira vitifoliae]XP_050538257.1 F-box only protein 28-like [Daktulosphaira vitifoliae]
MVATRQQCSGSSSSGTNSKLTVLPKPEKNILVGNVITCAPYNSNQSSQVNLLDLPYEVLEKILSYTSFKQISQLRAVSRQLNVICSTILNSTFQRLQNQMLHRFQIIKAKMPRRESARRQHPLACESDIVETLHMRLLLLRMAFGKHIERKHICFFAGEILDEVYKILHYIKVTKSLARPYKVTDELFDLSTMAMEYFRERIEPTLPEIRLFANDYHEFPSPLGPSNNRTFTSMCLRKRSLMIREGSVSSLESKRASSESPQCGGSMLRKNVCKIKQGIKTSQNCHLERDFFDLRKQLRKSTTHVGNLQRELKQCKSQIADQHKTLIEYSNRMDEYDKKNEETNRKFSTLLQELNKCKTEIQYLQSASSSSTLSVCSSCNNTSSNLSLAMGPPILNSTVNSVRTRLHNQGEQSYQDTVEEPLLQVEPSSVEESKSADEQEPSTSTGLKRKMEVSVPKVTKRVRTIVKKVRNTNSIS